MLRNQRDQLLRMIQQAAATIARLRQRLREGEPADEILQEARDAQRELLGKEASVLALLDARSAAHVLGDADRVSRWAELMRVEADALRTLGRSSDADRLERRARELAAIAQPDDGVSR